MKYHIARGETQLGAWTPDELAAKYNAGELQNSDLIWREGLAEWSSFGDWLGSSEGREFEARARSGGGFPPPPPAGIPAGSRPPLGTPHGFGGPPKPSNYLVQAILVTLFCCLPLGIVSIVFAAQVDSKYSGGDFAGAQKASENAKLWCWIAFGIGLAGVLGYGLLMGFGAFAQGFQSY